jgi:hypothetical protein
MTRRSLRIRPLRLSLRGARTSHQVRRRRSTLREQLRAQKQRYETEIADLKGENRRLEQALAAAHGELHRRGHTGTADTSQRR